MQHLTAALSAAFMALLLFVAILCETPLPRFEHDGPSLEHSALQVLPDPVSSLQLLWLLRIFADYNNAFVRRCLHTMPWSNRLTNIHSACEARALHRSIVNIKDEVLP